MLGERIVTDEHYQEYAKGNKSSVQDLARNTGKSYRTLAYAIQFYEKYPNLDEVPEGKNITWNKLITIYLAEPKEDEPTEGGYYYLMLGMIKDAIRKHDKEYLLDENTIEVFGLLRLPYEPVKDWVSAHFQSMEDILCGMMDSRFVAQNIEEVDYAPALA